MKKSKLFTEPKRIDILGRALAALLATTSLTACAASPAARHDLAQEISHTGGMTAREIVAPPYILSAWDRIRAPGEAANVYIEGDGLAWLGRNTKSLDPTPTDPIALRLAALDPAVNVIYLARPCQYSKMSAPEQSCDRQDWTEARFSARIITAMNAALDQIKAQTKVTGFNLVGYSGGGGVAALIAAQRNDVFSLRSVAGNLDHVRFTEDHGVSPMTGSLNPRDSAAAAAHIPQLHFIGADDTVITPDIFASFRNASGNQACVHSELVPGVTHNKGWIERWPELLKHKVSCDTPPGQ